MSKFGDIRGAAFGLGDTLIDDAPDLAATVGMVLYALKLPVVGEEHIITWIGNGVDILMGRALTWARQERVTLRKTVGKPPADDNAPVEEQVRTLRKLLDRYYGEIAEEGTSLFPHVTDTLDASQAKGLPLGSIANKPTPFIAPLSGALDIAKYFSAVIGGNDVQNKKPHPDLLLLVAKRIDTVPQQMLSANNLRSDTRAAKAAGCPSVGLTYGYSYGEATDLSQPDVIYQSLSDLLPALGLPRSESREPKND